MYDKDKILRTLHEIHEESKQITPYVVVVQPRRSKTETPAQNFNGHENIHVDMLGHSHGYLDICGEKVDVARNYLIETVLDECPDAKYLFFIGEDTVVPYDAFIKLKKTCEQNPGAIATGVYYIKASIAMIMVRENNMISVPNVDPGQTIEAWMTGMDCMLIPIELLKQLKNKDPDLPFCCIARDIPGLPFIGEDNFFVHRVHKAGIKLLVNTDVQCLHVDLASGKYTAHPSVNLNNFHTNIDITEPLTRDDAKYLHDRWHDRIPEGSVSYIAKINKLIEEGKPVKFNMGCGSDLIDGYLNVDKYKKDVDIKDDLFNLKLPQDCADEILASHIIEHVYYMQAPELLKLWFNALKPGGKLILELPDLEAQCKAFLEGDDQAKFEMTVCIYGCSAEHVNPTLINKGESSPHLWGFYPKVLSAMLSEIGYKDIQILPAQKGHMGCNFRVEATK